MSNLKSIVEAAGGSLACVVKSTVLLINMDDFDKVNAIYGMTHTTLI
jgi:enamine deaminase RidA (YjgF/YER057c/UK114 family)